VAAAASASAVVYARHSAAAAKTTAALDSDRRHDQLTPQFELIFTPSPHDGSGDRVTLKLDGPDALGWLDEVVVAILDEPGHENWNDPERYPNVPADEARLFVWGPWQFATAPVEEIADNRTTNPLRFSLPGGRSTQSLRLERTRPGWWMDRSQGSQERWERDRKGPIRLGITCRRGDEKWCLPAFEVQTEA